MSQSLIARASIIIDAPRARVWKALVDPKAIKQYMFGTTVASDWSPGSTIAWKGEWQGKRYEDRGVILQIDPERTLQYTHFSPLAGLPDLPENYHTVTIELEEPSGDPNRTRVSLAQDNNQTAEAQADSERNWGAMLDALKKLLEA